MLHSPLYHPTCTCAHSSSSLSTVASTQYNAEIFHLGHLYMITNVNKERILQAGGVAQMVGHLPSKTT
jgi:hypothetical protein